LREEAAEVVDMVAVATVVAAEATGEAVFMARSEDFMDLAGLMVLRIMAARCI
jgi:hypothetical protein